MRGKVFIIGLGLIGGSLALSIKRSHSESIIIGFDINHEQSRLAGMLGIVDEIVPGIVEGASEADLILIAAPVQETERIIHILKDCNLKEDVIISDAGSTKKEIVAFARTLKSRGITFIGGHPMAGSHKSGVTAAKSLLFENAFYLLTPDDHISASDIEKLKKWLSGTKAKFLTISPEEHDYVTGIVSHFPHIVAASLVHQAEITSRTQMLIPRLAAGGFRDITRIASSSPAMWRDILLQNKNVLLQLMEEWLNEMEKVKTLLDEGNSAGIYEYFSQAKRFRDELPQKEKGAIPAFYDLFVEVPDYPGVISEITGYLAEEEISITNIRILETREEIYGILVISFQTEADRERAINCIEKYSSYETTIGL
ncbi:prephenate dehydrogenase [Cytobacillus sp. NCCP-133]|uniref:prephenate dehydrogenase n=1 Tax=Cytobacillus sp. NCCP-133 TaxID=766848 RepID=UPI0022323E57|nr:prephenate dehydrogenase [Cytobacillus sp. NCCP-133]GLB57987.1 prephenate dehydrogenase [Cytobacillus sp. NCCP-133]